ncbi:MAG: nuoN 2 [Planctomycetaceae bacterium]|nr:nuoN 2 [Planctomycetaceae bacterium]
MVCDMNFSELLSRVVQDTVGSNPFGDLGSVLSGKQPTLSDGSLLMFLPELIVVATILGLLFVRLLDLDKIFSGQSVALLGSTVALMVAVVQFLALKNFDGAASDAVHKTMFTGLLVYDAFTVFFKVFLLLFLQLVVYLTRLTGLPDRDDAPDFYTLLFGSTLGMLLMVSSNNLLMVFLGIEMTSVPSYAMVGFLKGRRTSSEAAFKYVVYGAGASGVMLYGISLLAGLLGTASFPEMAVRLNMVMGNLPLKLDATLLTLLLSIVMILVGFAFKLSIFPFHFWGPDAFEGASTEVAGFLSVASKGAAFALLVRVLLALVGTTQEQSGLMVPVYFYLGIAISVLAAVTATFGNLAAYSQNNIKRLLAYSTIAHAGYMLMAVGAMMVLLNATKHVPDPQVRWDLATRAVEGLIFYLWVYMFMNLGAFAVAAFIRNEMFSEDITDFGGLWTQAPVLTFTMACCMFSLIGMPPFGGFTGKFMIFSSLFQAGHYHWAMWGVLAIAGLNTVFSLFYYVRVLKFMFIAPPKDDARRVKLPFASAAGLYIFCLAVFVLLTGMWGATPLSATAHDVASVLFP